MDEHMRENVPLMLADLTWPEVQELVDHVTAVLLPLGACEQHGPGMTLTTDIVLATELCRQVSARLAPRVLVAPPIPWGLSDQHLGFPGTISLHPESFYLVIRDVVTSLLGHGFRRFLLVNGHGGNMAASEVICMRLRRETSVELVGAVTYFMLAPASGADLSHAGALETSYALALAPEVVKPERLTPPRLVATLPDLAPATIPWAFHEVTETGNLGDPTGASRERGVGHVRVVLDRLCEIVTALGEQAPAFQRSRQFGG
jgi:creatinine amidohydrolase